MRLYSFRGPSGPGVAIEHSSSTLRALSSDEELYPGPIIAALQSGDGGLDSLERQLRHGRLIDPQSVTIEPPIPRPGKVICAGLNYDAHTQETGHKQPDFPTIFVRVATSLVGHNQPVIAPRGSTMFDYEGELAAVVGRPGRQIARARAHEHIAGYAVFNDCTARDFSRKTTQWTAGKNFDRTGAFGPCLVTADDLPVGAAGLRVETKLNGEVVQQGNTSQMLYDVAALVEVISSIMTLEAGDVIVTGSPEGVGAAKNPPRFLQPGDVCEVEVEGVGLLRNEVAVAGEGQP